MSKFEIAVQGKLYKIDIEQFNGKRALVKVDGKPYEIDVKKASKEAPPGSPELARPSASTSVSASSEMQKGTAPPASVPEPPPAPMTFVPSGGTVVAPMPGLVLEVMASVGDHVEAGTPMVKIEAMKMENEIPAPIAGTVKEIRVKAGDRVSTDETLAVIDQG